MSGQLRVILDNTANNIDYLGNVTWRQVQSHRYYQGSSAYPNTSGNGPIFGSIKINFEGTSITLIGDTSPWTVQQNATISIDGKSPILITYAAPWTYLPWYQSQTLPDGPHTLIANHLDQTALDIVIVTMGPNTLLTDKTIFVDNNDPAIQYTGSWSEDTSPFRASSVPNGYPIGNTTQKTNTAGDTMTFRFTGTSISIYGIFSWTDISSISATYTIDDTVQLQNVYPVTPNSTGFLNHEGQDVNFLFFSSALLATGEHTLVMNITDIQNTIMILDYIIYSPSFPFQAVMPSISATTPSTTILLPSAVTTQTEATKSASHPSARKTSIEAIIGGCLGALVVVLGVTIFVYARMRRTDRDKVAVEPFVLGEMRPSVQATKISKDLISDAPNPTFDNIAFPKLSNSLNRHPVIATPFIQNPRVLTNSRSDEVLGPRHRPAAARASFENPPPYADNVL